MKTELPASALAPNNAQRLFVRYFIAILIDLVVLNLFAEYWNRVTVDTFTTSLIAAVLLQLLLQATFAVEKPVSNYFKQKNGLAWRLLRFLAIWGILFISKFVILWVLTLVLGDSLHFAGPVHGAGAFILLIVAMLAAEESFMRLFRYLGK